MNIKRTLKRLIDDTQYVAALVAAPQSGHKK